VGVGPDQVYEVMEQTAQPTRVVIVARLPVAVAVVVRRTYFSTHAFRYYLRSCEGNEVLRLAAMHEGLPDLTMPTEEQVHLAAESFRMLADPTRIKLLWALLQGESSVACLAELVGASPTAVSQHLAKLRLAGLVRGRRQGTFVYYTAADEHVRALLAEALFHAEHADRDLPDVPEHRHEARVTAASS
jgi:DNA-binding transcriptional ArsR family regulator